MPTALAAQFVDRVYAIGSVRRFLWRRWYGLLTQRLRRDAVLFLNYAYEESPPMALPLDAGDAAHRGSVQLYHRVAAQGDLANQTVLEVSCGHGGGASYLMRTARPRRYVGLDLNARGIRFCRDMHRLAGLEFVVGDAEKLPFADATFDVAINIEASHCYASFPQFLSEAARVLKPGGDFLYADFRFAEGIEAWERALAASPFETCACTDVSASVLRGMEMNSHRSRSLIRRHLPRFLHKAGEAFAGVRGSAIYNALRNGTMSYRIYRLKPLARLTPAV